METTNRNEEIEINLREIFAVVMDKIAIIALIAVLGAAISFTYTKFMVEPTYQSSTQVYVTNTASTTTTEQVNVGDLQSSTYLTKDYRIFVKSRPVLEQVISNLKLKLTTDQLAAKISVEIPTDTRTLTISVVDKDPFTAKNIADSVYEAAKTQILNLTGVEIKSVDGELGAELPTTPIGPNMKLNVLLGFLIGFVLAVAIIIIRFMLDDTIKAQEDVEKYLGISVLGLIPETETPDSKKKKKKRKIKR